MQTKGSATYTTRCHRGKVKRNNQDCVLYDANHSLGIIADGVGGKAFGEVASQLAVDASSHYLNAELENFLHSPERELANAIKVANEEIITIQRNEPKYETMSTTLTCFHIASGQVFFSWVGDSRVYLIKPSYNSIELLTKDHTLDQSKIDPIASPQLYKRAPHILTRMVGSILLLKPDTGTAKVESGDLVLACTDGLSNMVPDELILEYAITANDKDPNDVEALADRLLDRALDCGGLDNIGFVLTRVNI